MREKMCEEKSAMSQSEQAKPAQGGVKPVVGEYPAGDYWWCTCGLSANQPFCDGAHKREGCFEPLKVTLESDTKVAWCTCKLSKKGHLCDGSHKCLNTEPSEKQ